MTAAYTPHPGIIVPSLPETEYHSLPIPSSSTLKDLARMTPGQARWKWDHRPPPSEAMDFGSAVDCLLFTPVDYERRFHTVPMTPDDLPSWMVLGPSGESKAAKAARAEIQLAGLVPYKEEDIGFAGLSMRSKSGQEWRRRVTREGTRVLSAEQAHGVSECAQSIVMHPIAREWIDGAQYQVQVVADLGRQAGYDHEVLVRGMLDIWRPHHDMIIDLKTTSSADPGVFGKQIHSLGYHIQAALYCDLMEALGQVTSDVDWRWIVAENVPPYRVEVSRPARLSLLSAGRREYLLALRTWMQCTETGIWPTSTGSPVDYDLPHWAYRDHMHIGDEDE